MGSLLEEHPELMELGEKAQKVYAFLQREGESPAEKISADTGIPHADIEGVLKSLQVKGLIISRGESPATFALRFKDPALEQETGYMYYI